MTDRSARTSGLNIEPLLVKDVTGKCISLLNTAPFARSQESLAVLPGGLPDKLIPQTQHGVFLKLYVSERIINAGKLEITAVDFFPNYNGRISGA